MNKKFYDEFLGASCTGRKINDLFAQEKNSGGDDVA